MRPFTRTVTRVCFGLLLALAATPAARAQTAGVGIGTTTPTARLDVNGDLKVGTAAGTASLAIDQQLTNSAVLPSPTQTIGQSFTLATAGTLTAISVELFAGSTFNDTPLNLRQGNGPGGAVLATQLVTSGDGYQTFPLTTPLVLAAGTYSFDFTTTRALAYYFGDPYAGGTAYVGTGPVSNGDLRFRIDYTGPVAAVPALYAGATGGVGVNTFSPQATLHVAGAASTVRLDGLAGAGPRMLTTTANGTLGAQALPTDAQQLTKTGATISLTNGGSVTDADNQQLTKTGSTISLANGGTVTDDDSQTLSISGNTISLTNGGAVTVPASADNLGNHTATQPLQMGANAVQFGLFTGAKLNLFNTDYALGVQSGTQYARSGEAFAWFKGGSHQNGQFSPGAGGTTQMVLTGSGQLGIGTILPQATLHVGGTARIDALAGIGTRVVTTDASGNLAASSASLTDNLGNHTATQNLNLAGYQLVGNGGTQGVAVAADGAVRIANLAGTASRLVQTDADGTLTLANALEATPLAMPVQTSVVTGGDPVTVAYGNGQLAIFHQLSRSLQLFDARNAAAPVATGAVSVNVNFPYDMRIRGSYLYLVGGTPAAATVLLTYDLSSAAPALVNTLPVPNTRSALEIQGSYLYVAGQRLLTYDLTTPAAPAAVGSVALTGGLTVRAVAAGGGRLAVGGALGGGGSWQLYSLSNPAAPVALSGAIATPAVAKAMVLTTTNAYVGTNNAGTSGELLTYALATPATPALVQTVALPGAVGRLKQANGQLYGLVNSGSYPSYVAHLQLVGLSNPAAPTLGPDITRSGFSEDMALSPGYAHLVTQVPAALATYRLTGPALVTVQPDGSFAAQPVPVDADQQQLSISGATISLTNGGAVTVPGDHLGNHLATQTLNLNGNELRLKAANDGNHALQYSGALDGPQLYGYNGGALSYNPGSGPTPVLRWTGSGNVGVGLGGGTPANRLDLQAAPRTGTHATGRALYVTGDFAPGAGGVEFRHSGGTQGVGIGYNAIYAAGSNANQDLSLMPKGTGNVGIGLFDPLAKLHVGGNVRIDALAGGGPRMLTTDNAGTVSAQALPTDAQQLTKTGATISLTNGGSVTDADNQTLSISGATISLSNGGGYVTVPSSADNLGNHTATQPLQMGANAVQFGAVTGAKLNLFNTDYALGVQGGTQYFRSGDAFAWYAGGVHNDNQFNAGGGTPQMILKGGWLGLGNDIGSAPNAPIEVRQSSGSSFMYFHHPGVQHFSFGLDRTNNNLISINNGPGFGGTRLVIIDPNTGWMSVGAGNNFPHWALEVLGTAAATTFLTTSDARYKQDIRPLGGALSSVLALRGVRYTWNKLGIARGGKAGEEQIGLLAQEVEQILPELVSTNAEGFKAVNYVQLAPVLIEALKEQQHQIEALRTQVAAGEALEVRLQALEVALGARGKAK